MKVLISKQTGFLSRRDLQNSAGKRLYYCFVIFGFLIVLVCLLPAIWILLSSLKGTEELFRIPPTLILKNFTLIRFPEFWQIIGLCPLLQEFLYCGNWLSGLRNFL